MCLPAALEAAHPVTALVVGSDIEPKMKKPALGGQKKSRTGRLVFELLHGFFHTYIYA
jgi:hypothetical protein